MDVTNATVRPSPEVIFAEVGQETVLLDLREGVYYGLDEVGARAWALLQEHDQVAAVHQALLQEFEVSAEQLWQDLETFFRSMAEARLVELDPPLPTS